jgi:hypothetical protein
VIEAGDTGGEKGEVDRSSARIESLQLCLFSFKACEHDPSISQCA